MRDGGGGGGGRILIDPESLRRCASTLDNLASDYRSYASSLRGCGIPTLPAPIASLIPDGIHSVAAVLAGQSKLHGDAVELRSRALWADFANAYYGGYPLGGNELKQFIRGLQDGTLKRYAGKGDMALAGRWTGDTYKTTFDKDPAKLIELAKILHGSGGNKSFATDFVQHFGGDNLVRVPRVIQAMESHQALIGMGSSPEGANTKLAQQLELDHYQLKEDAKDLLASFSMVLAVATSSSDLSRRNRLASEEDKIAGSHDSWAVAQLVAQGPPMGHRFLTQVFREQVIPLVRRDSTDYMSGGLPPYHHPIGDITTDEKTLMLNALAANPRAAAEALSQPLPEKVYFLTPHGPIESSDPVELLYRGHWEDHGQAFAHVYTEATDYLQPQGDRAGTNAQGNELTWKLANQVLHGEGDKLDAATDALARDVTTHHLPAVFESAGTGGYEQSGTLLDDGRLYLSSDDTRRLFQEIAHDEGRDGRFLNGLSSFEAQYIAENVAQHPGDSYSWGYKVGAVNQTLLNAHNVQASLDFSHANAQQKLLFGAFKQTIGLLTADNPPLHIAIDYAAPAFEGVGKPDGGALMTGNFDAKLETGATVKAMLASGFYGGGHLHEPTAAAPPRTLLDGHRLVDYTDLHAPKPGEHDLRTTYDTWAMKATGHDEAYRWSVVGASDGLAGKEMSVPLGG